MTRRVANLCGLAWGLVSILGCGGAAGERANPAIGPASGDTDTRTKRDVHTTETATGTRTVVTTTTTRYVEAPSPPPRGADPWPGDPLVRFNVERLNDYRRKAGIAPLLYDAPISAFALQASRRLSNDHKPHAYFAEHSREARVFGSRSAENQGDWNGVPRLDENPAQNGKKQVDVMLKLMFDEGPGGGHHDNMLNPRYRRVGIGLVYAGDKLYMTNDFSD